MADPSTNFRTVGEQTHVSTEPLSSQHSGPFCPLASYWHLLVVLAVQGLLVSRGYLRAQQMQGAVPDRIALYQRTMLFAWLLLAFVLAGVRWHGSSLHAVLGERWRSMNAFLRDFGIALVFLIVSIGIGSLIDSFLGHVDNPATQRIFPQGRVEYWYWIALSISAGICEEAIYRGYLQRQFIALTRNVPAGIFLSGILFGAAHSYQGVRHAVPIGILGVLGGLLAYWCKSVRPGMIAHTLQDLIGGLMRH